MRRARGLRVSSPRDICIFCATRQPAIANHVWSPTASAQLRQLNSSSRSSQFAEAVVYKDAEPSQPPALSQAARMRQALAASTPKKPPAQAQGGYPSSAPRNRTSPANQPYQNTQPQSQRQFPNERRPTNRVGAFDASSRNQNRDRFMPNYRREGNNERPHGNVNPPQSRYTVNMDSRPHVHTPAFGSAHLRRRTDQPERAQSSMDEQRPAPQIKSPPRRAILDQDEISKLLGDNTASSNRQSKPFQPFARDINAQRKCWHCGATNHTSTACPTKPTLREQPSEQRPRTTSIYRPPQSQRIQSRTQSDADAAQAWAMQQKDTLETGQFAQPVFEQEDRRRNVEQDRRRQRFEVDEPMEVPNRFEAPWRRSRGRVGRRTQQFEEEEEEEERPQVNKQERKRLRAEAKKAAQAAKNEPTPIALPEYISVANLAGALKLRVEDFLIKLEDLGFEDVQNDHILNAEHAGLIAQEYNFEPIFQASAEDGDLYPAPMVDAEVYANLPPKPPVVTIMGHVDHGKTTILDYMRSTSVAATEFGGITQHIGAFSVPLANGRKITFLDTPGHSAFETMRARGANVTDIVVLVVAADDSVMPQTVEAIKHAQAAKVPIIVAINKIDIPEADPNAVKLDLGRHGIEIEDFGGDVQTVCVSGLTGKGIDELEEAITTLSEMLDHRADPQASVEGWVLEGTTKKSGRVATVLVRSGTLRQGSTLVAGTTWTRVRSLRNEAGMTVKEAGPGIAVEVDGWRDQPIAGDEVLQTEDEQHATSVSKLRLEKLEREQMARDMEAINEARRLEAERREAEERAESATANEEETKASEQPSGPEVISFVIKGDVSGSVEAVNDSISTLGNAEISARILRHGVGPPSEFDVQHAADAQGHIINFNTSVPNHVAKMAEEKGVKIIDSNIIYRVVESVRDLLSEKLKPKVIHKVTGEAEIAAVFDIGLGGRKKMKVAGSKVRNGQIDKGSKARVLRGETIVHDCVIDSLKNVKKDVETMRKDTECGIAFASWEEFRVGDRIQCYEEKFEKRRL